MANANQVIINGETILDLRSDTVTPETLQKGYTAHDKSGTKITGTLEASSSGGAKETWVLNNTINTASAFSFSASFISNGISCTGLKTGKLTPSGRDLKYTDSSGSTIAVYGADVKNWRNQAYRKLTFDTPPTGDLLTWLQANGVKQPDDTAIQDTKAVTITSNGTVSVTSDVPYDALKKVDVTVNVASGGGETCKLKINVTQPPSNNPEWTLCICPGWLDSEEIVLDANNPSAEISIPSKGLFVLYTNSGNYLDSAAYDWGVFDYLNAASGYIALDYPNENTYVCYAGDTGTGTWDIRFH